MTKIASGVPIRPALAVRRRGWGNLYGGVERVEPVSGGAGRDPSAAGSHGEQYWHGYATAKRLGCRGFCFTLPLHEN